MDKRVEKLKEYMDASQDTVAVTGAGISYMYGVRRLKQKAGPNDWVRKMAPDYIKSRPDEVYALWKDSFLDVIFETGPGPVHRQLAELEKRGKLQGIVTQNLDCLHTLAGSGNVVAFMGSFADNVCLDCGARVDDVNIWNQGEMPHCPKCGGYLVPVYFARFGGGPAGMRNEPNPFMERAKDMIAQADLLLIIGTTGFHSDEYMSRRKPSAKMVQINPGRTIFDGESDLNIHRNAEEVLDEILAAE